MPTALARYGGVGETFDWKLARKFVDENPGKRVILAGGLNPENVREAVAAVAPFAVDIASGVESAPGVKEPGQGAAADRAGQGRAVGL